MSPAGNLQLIQVGEEPNRRVQNSNRNKNQETNMAEKEDDTDSTATKTLAIFTSTTIDRFTKPKGPYFAARIDSCPTAPM